MTGRPTARRLARPAAHVASLAASLAAALLLAPPLAAEPAREPAKASPKEPLTPAAAPRLPAEAQAFVTRRAGCAHWGGEEAYDAARGRQIAAAVKRLRCDAVEADEARLRRRHRDDPAILRALDPEGESGD